MLYGPPPTANRQLVASVDVESESATPRDELSVIEERRNCQLHCRNPAVNMLCPLVLGEQAECVQSARYS